MPAKYKNFDHRLVEPLLNNRVRLAILAAVAHSDEVDFMSLKSAVKTTDGNLSIQLKKLEEAGLVIINKYTTNNRTQTNVALTNRGYMMVQSYRKLMETWFNV